VQVETPHHPPSTFAEFIRQYAMIVLSILTALALEQVAVAVTHAAAARASKARIETELAHNAAEVANSLKINTENTEALRAALRTLVDLLKAGTPSDDQVMAVAKTTLGHFSVDLPGWQRDAWDSAIADQSASHLQQSDLRRYAEIYDDEKDATSAAILLLGGEWVAQSSDLMLDYKIGKIDPKLLASTLARLLAALQQISAGQKELQAELEGHASDADATHK
jgi:hypothetical protein